MELSVCPDLPPLLLSPFLEVLLILSFCEIFLYCVKILFYILKWSVLVYCFLFILICSAVILLFTLYIVCYWNKIFGTRRARRYMMPGLLYIEAVFNIIKMMLVYIIIEVLCIVGNIHALYVYKSYDYMVMIVD